MKKNEKSLIKLHSEGIEIQKIQEELELLQEEFLILKDKIIDCSPEYYNLKEKNLLKELNIKESLEFKEKEKIYKTIIEKHAEVKKEYELLKKTYKEKYNLYKLELKSSKQR